MSGSRVGLVRISLRYIAREYLFSFSLSFLFFFIIFFINQILLLAEDILSRNAPFAETALLLFYSLPAVVAIAFPFAALSGALMTSAHLNADNEILAFSASGISPGALYSPFIVLGILASVLSFTANDYFLPRGAAAFQKLYGKMVARSASLELSAYSIRRYSEMLVATGPRDGDAVRNLLLFEKQEGGAPVSTIAAALARLEIEESGNSATLNLNDVQMIQSKSSESEGVSISNADSVSYRFMLREPLVGYGSTGPSEMSSSELAAAIRKKSLSLEARVGDSIEARNRDRARLSLEYGFLSQSLETSSTDSGSSPGVAALPNLARLGTAYSQSLSSVPRDRSLGVYRLEYHKKFAIPAAGFFFSLLAFPLGLGAKRSGRTAGFGMALLISTLYWGLLFAGQSAGLRLEIDPRVAMWAPDALVGLAALAVWFVRKFGTRRSI